MSDTPPDATVAVDTNMLTGFLNGTDAKKQLTDILDGIPSNGHDAEFDVLDKNITRYEKNLPEDSPDLQNGAIYFIIGANTIYSQNGNEALWFEPYGSNPVATIGDYVPSGGELAIYDELSSNENHGKELLKQLTEARKVFSTADVTDMDQTYKALLQLQYACRQMELYNRQSRKDLGPEINSEAIPGNEMLAYILGNCTSLFAQAHKLTPVTLQAHFR